MIETGSMHLFKPTELSLCLLCGKNRVLKLLFVDEIAPLFKSVFPTCNP